jgi:endonuclease-3
VIGFVPVDMAAKDRNSTKDAGRVTTLTRLLAARWPDAVCELTHDTAFQLLCGTILAAQSTDKLVNTVTPTLLARWPDARALAGADPAELEQMIHSTGFFRMKAKALLGMARALVERHGGLVPRDMASLVALPGVGRKTANVVRGTIWGLADGVVVDTHVTRLSQRLALTKHTDPVKIEQDLMQRLPPDQWISFANRLIWHGRRVCTARKPDCEHCELAPVCPSAFAIDRAPAVKVKAKKAKQVKIVKKAQAKPPAKKKPAVKARARR